MENLLSAKLKEVNKTLSDKTSSIETTLNDLTDGVALLADVVLEIPKMVDEKISAIELMDPKEPTNGINGKDGIDGSDGKDGKDGQDGIDGIDGSPDSPEDIAKKLNTLKSAVDISVIKGADFVTNKTLATTIGELQNQTRFLVQSNASKTNGLTSVTTDTTLSGDGTNSNPLSVAPLLVDNQTIFGDGINIPLFAQANSNNRVISGGASWSGTGYIFDVSALTYWFDGVLLGPTTPTQITLDAADPTNDRFDAIVVDQAGTISKITGTAAINPVFPAIPATQLLVQYVNVGAGTTQLVLLQDLMYDENTGPTAEWTATQFDTTTGALGTVNVASTNAPYRGTKCVQATAVNYRRGLKLVRATAIDIQQYAYVQVWYRNDGVALPTTKNPYFQFQNTSGNVTGNNVNLLTYGASRTIVNTWQLVVIPVSAFGNITLVKGARVLVTGGTLASTANFSVDFMLLSGGILPQGAIGPIYLSPSNTLYSTGAGTGATAVTDSIFFGNLAGFQATAASNSIFQGAGAGYGATNAEKSVFLGVNAGSGAASANWSVFLGENAGNGALNAGLSVFIGKEAGMGANASDKMYGIGYQALKGSLGYQNMAWGHRAGFNEAGDQNLMIGYEASAGGFSGSIVLGNGATATANSQFIVGSASAPITDVLLGDHTNTVNGDAIHINGANDRIDMMAHGENRSAMVGKIISLTDNTVTSVFEIALPAGGMTGGFFTSNVTATDGTDIQAHSDHVTYAAVNKGGVYTTTIQASNGDDAIATSTGTLAVTWSITTGTNKIIIRVNANSSLSAPTINLRLNIMNNGGQAITIL